MHRTTLIGRRIVAIMLIITMFLSMATSASATRTPANTSSTENLYSDNWIYWSQGASKYWGMRGYGCRMVSQSKLLMETGIASSSNFDPDVYFEWCGNNGYVDSSTIVELRCGQGPGAYAREKGKTLSYNGQVNLYGNKTDRANQIMSYINQGYYVILGCSAHHAYVGRNASLQAGTPVIYDSWSGNSYNDAVVQKYVNYSLVNFSYFWIYSTDSSNSTTASATVTTGSTDSVTEAGTVLRGSFTATGARATKCGMYIGTSAEVSKMTELGSDSVNTYGTNMYYSTSKYGYKLTAGTIYYYRAYAIVNNETYWGDAKSFFVPISIGIGITDVDTTEEEKSGASGSNTSGHQSLTLGTTGDDVKTMQTMLNSVTFAKLSVEGSFGNNTLKALKNYQTQRGLTVDGVCGAKTWSALESDYKSGKTYCTHTSSKFLSYEAAHPHYNYYQCNTCGEKFTDGTTVKVKSCTTCYPVKATVTTKGADNITQTSAIVRGEVTVSSGKLTECGMFIGKTPDSLAFMGRDYISKGTPFYYSTSKFNYPLTAGTTYYYRAYAFVDGEAIWGDMKSFTTLKATATQTATVVGTSGEYLAINNGPASSSAGKSTQIGRIPPGGVVTVDMSKKSGNWYWVTYNGVSGYAYSGYLSLN